MTGPRSDAPSHLNNGVTAGCLGLLCTRSSGELTGSQQTRQEGAADRWTNLFRGASGGESQLRNEAAGSVVGLVVGSGVVTAVLAAENLHFKMTKKVKRRKCFRGRVFKIIF